MCLYDLLDDLGCLYNFLELVRVLKGTALTRFKVSTRKEYTSL